MLHMLDDSEIFKAVIGAEQNIYKLKMYFSMFEFVFYVLLISFIIQRYFTYKMYIHHKSNPKTIIAGATIFILYRDKK